ncbi:MULTISPECIES: glycosyltransferase family 4 protein [Brevibacillus]|uniref:glycosyltransferase family 4 protein n=1 Tax=Brevibacillus TaxID=55080 RepID=UPI000D0ED55C|nr:MULTISPECIES: glycosyltransferase family 4 protein [Brevibacillus]PSJ66464.1 glycosyltransferase family 1 protein [Brevibacillus brevis]RED24119.1 spore coat protein SA [Brevibacillus brevis]TQK73476.1 spore coat protein SA [Brevibacillus sp. AG162]VEF90227.1 Spore coat protein SA [Brevibacillus brevis]
MRILVIAPEQLPIPPITGGSVETCIYNIFRRMANQDSVTIISRAHPRLPGTSHFGRLKIVRIPQRNRLSYIRAALRRVRGQSFDIIQIENRPTFVPIVRAAFPRTPIVLSLHSLTFMSQLSHSRANAILSQVKGVTSVVSFVSQTMRKRYPRHAYKFKTAILGVDTSKFRPRTLAYKQALRKRWGVGHRYNVLFVGRIVPMKGLHTLVRAVAILKKRYPSMGIVAVGASWPGVRKQTAYMRKVRQLSQRLNVPIRFTGYLPPSQIHKMYHLGDVFVCPTQYREGFATVNSEAMASGIPVVASKRGGISEVVNNGSSGLLVRNYLSPRAFAHAIARVKSSPSLARRLAYGGRQRVKARFSWYSTVSKLRGQYRAIKSRRKI